MNQYTLPATQTPTPEQGARIAQELKAAMERIADHYLSSEESMVTGGDRCTLHIHTDMNTLKADGAGHRPPYAQYSAGHPPRARAPRRRLPFPRLHRAALCGRTPYPPLGRRRRDQTR